jgi:hypothetical protein
MEIMEQKWGAGQVLLHSWVACTHDEMTRFEFRKRLPFPVDKSNLQLEIARIN